MKKQSIFDIALKTFLLLSPIFFFRAYKLSFAQGMFFVFASFALFGISLALKPIRRFSNYWMALFLLWALVRVFVGGDFGDSASEWFNFWLSSASFIYVFAGVLLFYTIYCHAEDPKDYIKPIVIVCIMNFVLVIAQMTGHDFMWARAPSLCGFMGTSSQLGQYSAMSMPIVAFISPWFLIVPAFALFMAKSVSSIVALSVGLVFWSWQRKKKLMLLLLIIPLALGYSNRHTIAQKWRCRPIVWKKTLNVALKHPYLGTGYRSFNEEVLKSMVSSSIGGRELRRAHSDPIHTTQEMGFPAMIIIGGFFIGLWKKFREKKNKDKLTYFLAASVLIVLVNGCGQTLIRYASIAGTFTVLLALLCIKLQGEEDGYYLGNHHL